MKIRSDFVTNSSSSNTASLRIKCEPLAEMMDNYRKSIKEAGLGEFPSSPSWSELSVDASAGEVRWYWDEYGRWDIESGETVPKALADVLDCLCEELANDAQLAQESGRATVPVAPLIRAIMENRNAIVPAIEDVSWRYAEYVRGEFLDSVDDPEARQQIIEIGSGAYNVEFSYDGKTGEESYASGWSTR